jgi:hypothetical protein
MGEGAPGPGPSTPPVYEKLEDGFYGLGALLATFAFSLCFACETWSWSRSPRTAPATSV